IVIGAQEGFPPPKKEKGKADDRDANRLLILPGTAVPGGVLFDKGSVLSLTAADAEAIRRDCPAVVEAAPVVRARPQVKHGKRSWAPVFICGSTPAYLKVRCWELAAGRAFTDDDVRARKPLCIVGQTIAQKLFDGESPVGKEIIVGDVPLKVVGLLS